MEACTHPECNSIREITGLLFDGKPLKMVDASEDTPGAMPYGTECRLRFHRGFFQVQHPDTGQWHLVTITPIADPVTQRRLSEFADSIGAQPDSTASEETARVGWV